MHVLLVSKGRCVCGLMAVYDYNKCAFDFGVGVSKLFGSYVLCIYTSTVKFVNSVVN